MKTGKMLLIGCGVTAAVLLALAAAVIAFFWHVAQDPKDVTISIESPDTVALKEEFTVTVVVHNERTKRDFGLTDVDVAEDYLQGFLILGTDPKPKTSVHVPIDNKRSYSFNQPVKPGGTARFAFRLRPLKAGLHRGDVDVCEGMRFLTTQLQTLVEEPK
jgi:hypothetical protein